MKARSGIGILITCWLIPACVEGSPDVQPRRPERLMSSGRACTPAPDSVVPALVPVQVDALAGQYALTVIGTQGMRGDTLVRGTLELWLADSVHAHFPWSASEGRIMPLAGATDIDLRRLAPVSLAHSPASRDVDRPGVQGQKDGTLWLGNSFNGKGITTDAGVLFRHIRVDETGFRGEWIEGGLTVVDGVLPAGYFCAVRLDR